MRLPDTISLNAIDRSYLISEDDAGSAYFPMTLNIVVALHDPLTVDQVQQALMTLQRTHPFYRLQYRLDPARNRWQRLDDDQIAAHISAMVAQLDDDTPLDGYLAGRIAHNTLPHHYPIRFHLLNSSLIIEMHHSFGDAHFFLHLIEALLSVIKQPEASSAAPVEAAPWLPMSTLVRQNPLRVLKHWFNTTFRSYQDYKRDIAAPDEGGSARQPVTTGYPMGVRRYTVPPEVVAHLNRCRKALSTTSSISFNTLLQVLIGEALYTITGDPSPITYTIPVDLSRYLDDTTFYPGNVASQIRVTLPQQADVAAQCRALQAAVQRQLEQGTPLANLPNEWLLRLAGDRRYDRVNRNWLIASTMTDPRRFVLSNLGDMTRRFAAHRDILDFSRGIHVAIPLMGGPGIVICASTLDQRLNLTITYDPQRYDERHLDAITRVFDPHTLDELADRQGNG